MAVIEILRKFILGSGVFRDGISITMTIERIVFLCRRRVIQTIRNFQTLSYNGFPLYIGHGRRACLNRKSRFCWAAGSIAAMATTISVRGRARSSWGFRSNCSVPSFHIRTTVALVCAYSAETRSRSGAAARGVRKGAGALELAENGFFVREKVSDEAIAVSFVHGEGGVYART